MIKTTVMLLALAVVTGAGLACFGMFSDPAKKDAAAIEESCEGLEGQAKIDCENRNRR
jgi:hypothetical protein